MPFVGLSMGGGVTIGYALEHPERFNGAVLLGPGGLGDKVQNQFLSWLLVRTPGLLRYMTKYYAKLAPENRRKTMVSLLDGGENTAGLEDLLALITKEPRQKWDFGEKTMDDCQLEGHAPFRLKVSFLPELHRLTCPVLYLRGENDPLVGQKVMEEAARLTTGSILHVVKNAGHLVPLEQPDEINKAVAAFLEEHRL